MVTIEKGERVKYRSAEVAFLLYSLFDMVIIPFWPPIVAVGL
jgi:hypothetical protein